MPSTTETPRQVELGQFMLTLRRRAGATQEQVAAYVNARRDDVNRAHTHVSRWERGQLLIREDELTAVLAYLGATSAETVTALKLHRDAADPNWMVPGVPRPLAVLREYEDQATKITNAQPRRIPGPLQIEDYAREVTTAGAITEAQQQQVPDLVAFRMARRASLLSGSTRFEALISEAAIRYPPCTPETALRQLRDLMETSARPNIEVRVTPLKVGYDPMTAGPFVLLESDGAKKAVVNLEHFRSSTTLTDKRDVDDYQVAAERIRSASMNPVASARFIEAVANQLENTT